MKEIKIIITVSVCLIAVFSSFMWIYSRTLQRTADDLVKIKSARLDLNVGKECVDKGGKPVYSYNSELLNCEFGK